MEKTYRIILTQKIVLAGFSCYQKMMKLKDMNWNQVYYFYEIARKQSLKNASQVLGVSSATLSEHIKKLEAALGFELFHRNHKGLSLTKEGENLFNFAKDMFDTGMRLVDSVSSSSMGGYPVKVGILDTISDLKSLHFVSQYYDIYAPYGIVHTAREYFSDNLFEQLARGNYDWIITTERPKGKQLGFAEIDSFKISFCCARAIVDRFKNKKDIFSTIPLALNHWDQRLNKVIKKYLQDNGVTVDEVIETDHRELSFMLAERGRCVAPVDEAMIKEQNWLSDVAIFNFGEIIDIPIYIAWKNSSSKMLSIQKLEQLVHMGSKPLDYNDPELLIKIADVPKEKLKSL